MTTTSAAPLETIKGRANTRIPCQFEDCSEFIWIENALPYLAIRNVPDSEWVYNVRDPQHCARHSPRRCQWRHCREYHAVDKPYCRIHLMHAGKREKKEARVREIAEHRRSTGQVRAYTNAIEVAVKCPFCEREFGRYRVDQPTPSLPSARSIVFCTGCENRFEMPYLGAGFAQH